MENGFSVSATQGDIAPEHDRREYEPRNVDRRLSAGNRVIIDTPNEREAFNGLFAGSIDTFNAKQKRNDRKRSYDYLSEIESDNRVEKPFYEYVFQIGNRDTNGVTTSDFDKEAWKKDKKSYDILSCVNDDADRLRLKSILDAEMETLQERYPSFHFWSIIGHDDEPDGTYHYHVRFTPVGVGYKKGMNERCSLTKALNNMGYYSDDADFGITQWQNDVKDHIAEAMEKEGFHREFMSNEEEHLSTSLYKMKMEKERLGTQITEEREELEDIRISNKNAFDLNKKAKQKLKEINENITDIYEDMRTEIQTERHLDQLELTKREEGLYGEMADWQDEKAQEKAEIKDRNKKSLEMYKNLKRAFMGVARIEEILPIYMRIVDEYEKRDSEKAQKARHDAEGVRANIDYVKKVLADVEGMAECGQCDTLQFGS